MEMHQVRYFLAVARTLNFTKAAAECNVAQPSLSRAIIKLEEELGGDLFRRERTLTHLTELGRLMVPVLTQCYESALSAKALATAYKKGTALPLRFALSHSINLGLFAGPLSALVKTFPGLELEFFRGNVDEIAEALKTGKSEVAVGGRFSDEWERFDRWALFSEKFVLAVNKKHPLAMRNIASFSQLSEERLLPRPYCEMSGSLSGLLRKHGIGERGGDRIASDHDLLSLLEANVGVAIVPESAPTGDRVSRLAVEGLDLERSVYLYAVAGRERSAASNALIKLLRMADWQTVRLTFGASADSQGAEVSA